MIIYLFYIKLIFFINYFIKMNKIYEQLKNNEITELYLNEYR